MRVLVTGGAGFIGSHVADRLAAEGHEPVVLDALIPQAHGGEKPPWVGELVRADVRDTDALREALRGIDAVCHQAAMVGHGVDARDAPAYAAHNDLGTAVLLAAMYEAGVSRLVLAGSMVVYGEGRYTCAEHGVVRPGPARPRRHRRRAVRAALPGLRPRPRPRPGARGRAARPAQHLRRHQAGPGAPGERVGAPDRRSGVVAALPQRVRPADAARHALLRGGVGVPVGAGTRRAAAGDGGRAAAPRLRARRRRRRGQRPRPRRRPGRASPR